MSVQALGGDCREMLRTLPDESVHCVVTSPPYWGLRDYGVDGQLGLEPTPELYVEHMVEVFREVRRVLRDDGTVWLNLGDSYANDGKWGGSSGGKHVSALHGNTGVGRGKRYTGLKPKDLVGIPWRVAFALQADGWYLRQDIIWHKPNPMPESVTDRCTKAHEYIFLLSKSERYYFDADAIKEPANPANYRANPTTRAVPPGQKPQGTLDAKRGSVRCEFRNKRSVWTIATKSFPEAHFATFPTELAKLCILAGTSERGACVECGAPWKRLRDGKPLTGTGWSPTCEHTDAATRPCVVLDPFGGAGTTGLVADRLHRDAILIELNPEYAAMARRRIERDAGMFAEVALA